MEIKYIKDKKIGCLKELEKKIGYDNLTKLITLNYITTKSICSKGIYIWFMTDHCQKISFKEKLIIRLKRFYYENLRNF